MQQIAADVGFSETAYIVPSTGKDRSVRYFSPGAEVSFCGHATIAAGAVLGETEGDDRYRMVHLLVSGNDCGPGGPCTAFRWQRRWGLFHGRDDRITQACPIETLHPLSFGDGRENTPHPLAPPFLSLSRPDMPDEGENH